MGRLLKKRTMFVVCDKLICSKAWVSFVDIDFEGRSWNYRKWIFQHIRNTHLNEDDYHKATIEAEQLKLNGQIGETEWRSMVRLANQSLLRNACYE
ncbi:hypothetical protein NJH76_17885 [Pseudomonas sp. 2]|uniref:hypothetical protein n=1 Tax=Pseudomonas sp. 2 TaxID=336474 RepID=UPI00209B22FE|nr:hypothetical protein [Pseudomonas sp. 2]MCO7531661.1 hypothetical protein [Pseudomonas sp. 2]